MKRTITLFLFGFSFLLGMAQNTAEKTNLKNEVEREVKENILAFWLKNAPDPYGGFYGEISREGKGNHEASKGAVLGARILWTFSSAYRIYGYSEYKALADRAQAFCGQTVRRCLLDRNT